MFFTQHPKIFHYRKYKGFWLSSGQNSDSTGEAALIPTQELRSLRLSSLQPKIKKKKQIQKTSNWSYENTNFKHMFLTI